MSSLRQQIDESILQQIQQALADGALRRYVGQYSEALEAWLQSSFGSPVLLANSGTAALELALRAVGLQPGDEVILSGYDYPGNFWVIEQLGCVPVLVDVLKDSTRLDLNLLEEARTDRTRACIVSHLHGQLQQMDSMRRWADQTSVVLVEDACQALGARIGTKQVGTSGHLGILSFSGSKVISAGRGGALLTRDEKLFQRAKIASGAGSGAYGLSELSAAIVLAQLPWLESINACSQNFFEALQRSMEMEAGQFPAGDFPGRWLNDEKLFFDQKTLDEKSVSSPAYYQAGWVMQSPEQCSAAIARLQHLGVAAGGGFVGFHRRSRKRCRAIGELAHTAALVHRLLVIHHSVAMDQRFSSQQLAATITGSTTGSPE